MSVDRFELKQALAKATHCEIQHDGWPCGTCFFGLSEKFKNSDWQALLLFRGDYRKGDLDNLPEDVDKAIENIFEIAKNFPEDGVK